MGIRETEEEQARIAIEEWSTIGLNEYKGWVQMHGEEAAKQMYSRWKTDPTFPNSPAFRNPYPRVLGEIWKRTDEKIREWAGAEKSRVLQDDRPLISNILQEQVETFHREYDIDKYSQLDDNAKENFIIQLKYWIKKFEIAEELKAAQVSLRNSLITFTATEVFQHEAQLETVRILLPFLRAQLKLAELESERERIPKVRQEAIQPLGSITLGEMRLRIAEQSPEFVTLSQEEQTDIIHKAILEIHSKISKIPGNPYMMDTATIGAQWAQQLKENQENYLSLLKASEQALKAIEDAPTDLPHSDKVKLQQRSVKIQLAVIEFQQWFSGCGLPIPGSTAHWPQPIEIQDWTGNKSEFCRFVQNEYEKHKDQYASLRDATFKLFERYRFEDKRWTAFDCYELVKKV